MEVYDLSGIVDRTTNQAERVAVIPTVTNEKLPAKVLHGKRIFNDASDRRMNRIGDISCALSDAAVRRVSETPPEDDSSR